jgi:hypothetical protein
VLQLTAEDASTALAQLSVATPPKLLDVVRPTVRRLYHCLERNEASLSLESTITALNACIALNFASAPVLLCLVRRLEVLTSDGQQLTQADLRAVADAITCMHATVVTLPDTGNPRRRHATQSHRPTQNPDHVAEDTNKAPSLTRQPAAIASIWAALSDFDGLCQYSKSSAVWNALSSAHPGVRADESFRAAQPEAGAASKLLNESASRTSGCAEVERQDSMSTVSKAEHSQQQGANMLAVAAALKSLQRKYVEAIKFAVEPKSLVVALCRQVRRDFCLRMARTCTCFGFALYASNECQKR